MNPDKVVMHVVDRNRSNVVLDLFREGIRQPSESSDLYSHGQVLALHVAGALVLMCFGSRLSLIGLRTQPALALGITLWDQHTANDPQIER